MPLPTQFRYCHYIQPPDWY